MRVITKGSTDQSVTLHIVDNTTKLPATGLAYNSSGIDLWYRREGAAVVSITEATQTASGGHADGGFVHLANGVYRLDLPDAAVASGANYVIVGGTITGYLIEPVTIQLTAFNLQAASQSIVDEAAADMIAARVNASRGDFYPNAKQVWVLTRDGAGLGVKNAFQITMGEGETLKVWIDFASVVGKNEFIESIDSLELSGGSAVIVADSSGILGNLVYLQVEGGSDGDATTVDFEVTTTAGQVITGSVCVFNVVE